MLISIMAILLFMIGILGLLLYPKTEGRMNGMKMIVMGTMAIFCYLAFCAGIYNIAGIFVGLPATCGSLVLMDVLIWGGIFYRKKIQRLFWRVTDLLSLILITTFVVWIAMHVFTPELRLQYYNVDAASHFYYANFIVQHGRWPFLTYFSAYIDAVFIQVFSPLLSPILYFKAFIIADIFMHILEVWMFYYLVLTVSEKKIVRIMAPILSIGYFWGYPAYSFMEGHFVYWSNGVVIFIFILYALLLVEKHRELLKYSILLLLLGAYANMCCNKLFVPTNTLAILAVLAAILLQKYWKRIDKKRFLLWVCGAFLLMVIAAVIFLLMWGEALTSLFEDLIKPGGIYSALYADLIFFLPAWIYVLYHAAVNRQYKKTIPIASVCMLFVALGMYLLVNLHLMSGYYYYKIYYNLWLCGWILAAAALEIMAEKKQTAWYFSYVGMAVLIGVIALTDYDGKIVKEHEDYNGEYATTAMFSIYQYNRNNLLTDYEKYRISDQVLDVFNYALEQMSGTDVRIATQDWDLKTWHDGMDLVHEQGFYMEEYELTELLEALDQNGVQAMIVQRSDEKYQAYRGYFDRCEEVYGNEDAAILMPSQGRWFVIPEEMQQYAGAELELYGYIAKNYAGETVPLLADRSAYYDYMLYYMATGQDSSDFYPWNQVTEEDVEKLSEADTAWITAQKNLANLKERQVKYIVVLKGEAFFERVQGYLDAEKTVYENEAGKVIALDSEGE